VSEKQNIFIPVYVSELEGYNIRSFRFRLIYNKSILKFRSVYDKGTLSDIRSWDIDTDKEDYGVDIEADGRYSLSGSGILLYIKFEVLVEEGYTDLILDRFRFNYFNYPNATVENGSFSINVKRMISFKKSGEGNGQISVNDIRHDLPAEIYLLKGSKYEFRAIPYNSSIFEEWSGGINSDSNPIYYLVENPTDIYVDFNLKTYSVSAVMNPVDFGMVEGVGVYKFGDVAILNAVPFDGKEFDNWSLNGEIISESPQFTIDVDSDFEITANFKSSFLQITANTNPIEAGQITGTGYYYPDQIAELVATSNDNWSFINWTENGEIISEEYQLSFNVTEDRSLTANFTLITDIYDDDGFELQTFLSQPYPNPFNPTTTFRFGISNLSEVSLFVMDITGKIVEKILISKTMNKGVFEQRFNATNLSSGVYFYYFEVNGITDNRKYFERGKFILLK
jgi:hypothetical protein